MVCSQQTSNFVLLQFSPVQRLQFCFNCKLNKQGRISQIRNHDDILDTLSVHYYLISNTIASPQTYHFPPSPHSLSILPPSPLSSYNLSPHSLSLLLCLNTVTTLNSTLQPHLLSLSLYPLTLITLSVWTQRHSITFIHRLYICPPCRPPASLLHPFSISLHLVFLPSFSPPPVYIPPPCVLPVFLSSNLALSFFRTLSPSFLLSLPFSVSLSLSLALCPSLFHYLSLTLRSLALPPPSHSAVTVSLDWERSTHQQGVISWN